ncbi:MAG: TIR domain-containing protein [Chlorobium sp.]|nr:MAG: TIR domain-containing protein [Chlorobium sp.]
MTSSGNQIFLSYSGEDSFEASLLQFAVEKLLEETGVSVWTYERDQNKDEKQISKCLKEKIKESKATIFLASPTTMNSGATQWMELAYSDAFNVPTYILLHRMTYQDLKKREKGVPPLVLSSQCNSAMEWKNIGLKIGKNLDNRGSEE